MRQTALPLNTRADLGSASAQAGVGGVAIKPPQFLQLMHLLAARLPDEVAQQLQPLLESAAAVNVTLPLFLAAARLVLHLEAAVCAGPEQVRSSCWVAVYLLALPYILASAQKAGWSQHTVCPTLIIVHASPYGVSTHRVWTTCVWPGSCSSTCLSSWHGEHQAPACCCHRDALCCGCKYNDDALRLLGAHHLSKFAAVPPPSTAGKRA